MKLNLLYNDKDFCCGAKCAAQGKRESMGLAFKHFLIHDHYSHDVRRFVADFHDSYGLIGG
jgi:hypothetical protein